MNRKRIVVIACIVLIVGLGMVSTIVPWLRTPSGRAYNGMHGFSDDYVGYVSYIKEGLSGRSWVAIRSLPLPQTPTTIHHFYLWIGYAARFFGMSAPLAYHLARLILGAIFVFLVYRLFESQFGWVDAVLGTLVAFGATSISWFTKPFDVSTVATLSSFPFAVDVSGRATGRPHYLMADALFLLILLLYGGKTRSRYLPPAIFVCSFLLGIIHPAFAVILLFVFVLTSPNVLTLGGLLCSLAVSYWSVHQYPFVSILAFEGYVVGMRMTPLGIWREIVAFGPVFWFAVVGFSWATVKKRRSQDLRMFVWMLVILAFFWFLFPFLRAERVRFIQSLYFVPMAYGAILFFRLLAVRIGRWVMAMGAIFLIAISAPMYTLALYQTTTNMTDYRVFPTWIFPTTKQREAYRWIDKNTPNESTVLAGFEAANNILLYSHNFVIGNRQGWTTEAGNGMETARDNFYLGGMSREQAAAYVLKNNIRYVYSGYQERGMGDVSRYPFLSRVFHNGEVAIYVRNI